MMERTGIDDGAARKRDGNLGRNVSQLSFHLLGHSFNSAMANPEAPLEIRQKLTDHASHDMNKQLPSFKASRSYGLSRPFRVAGQSF
jgi:hypothetical protein